MMKQKVAINWMPYSLVILGVLAVIVLAYNLSKTRLYEKAVSPPVSRTVSKTSGGDLAKIMPVATDRFFINYLPNGDLFLVTITKEPFEDSKKEAQEWLKLHGIKDLCALNISWIATREVKDPAELTPEERSTPGCPLLPQT